MEFVCHPAAGWKMTNPRWRSSYETCVESLRLVQFLTVGVDHHGCLFSQQFMLVHTAPYWPLPTEVVQCPLAPMQTCATHGLLLPASVQLSMVDMFRLDIPGWRIVKA